MIRLSSGTAACMGLTSNRMDVFPTTAYLLLGSKCLMKCSFCPQGYGSSEALRKLGRITWPEYGWPEIAEKLVRAEKNGFRRICLQSVRHSDGIDSLLKAVRQVKTLSDLPLSLSAWIGNEDEAAELAAAGVESISVSLDAVNPGVYRKIKGGSFSDRLDLLISCARKVPGRIVTHIICGLGESEEETLTLIDRLVQEKVVVALFAFVPLKGTPLEEVDPPAVASYRRIQAGHYLIKGNKTTLSSLTFEKGRLVSYGLTEKKLAELLSGGDAFQASGCPDCNRPYYNERPGGTIYNYHRPLSPFERKAALDEIISSLKNLEIDAADEQEETT